MNWSRYFEQNRVHRLPVPWERGVSIPPALRAPLIRSLQRFQLGESGEGRHLRRQARTVGDPSYDTAIALFIREEQEHARMMGRILEMLGAPLLTRHWSDVCFVGLRRVMGLRTELLVLLIAEMIATQYFRLLRESTTDPVMEAVCAQILHDEEGHLSFHAEFLNRAFAEVSFTGRLWIQLIWRLGFRATCLVVMLDHRALFREAGESSRKFWDGCGGVFDEMAARIFSPARVLTAAAPAPIMSCESGGC